MLTRVMLLPGLIFSLALTASAQDSRGRKYKTPPDTSHIEVLVLKDNNQKPIPNAAVVFHSVKDGKDEGNLEIKTNQEGKAIIDVIPTGSAVDVQVIADGFATFASTYQVNDTNRNIEVRMIRPRAQISTYVDTRGQSAARPLGVQEPNQPFSQPVIEAPLSTNHTSDPTAIAPGAVNVKPGTPTAPQQKLPSLQTNPPGQHPDNQYPVDPATTSPNAPRPAPTSPPQV